MRTTIIAAATALAMTATASAQDPYPHWERAPDWVVKRLYDLIDSQGLIIASGELCGVVTPEISTGPWPKFELFNGYIARTEELSRVEGLFERARASIIEALDRLKAREVAPIPCDEWLRTDGYRILGLWMQWSNHGLWSLIHRDAARNRQRER